MVFILLFTTLLCAHVHVHATSEQTKASEEMISAQKKLMEMSSAFILSRAIQVAAALGVADHLVTGPCDVDQLASKVNAHPDALYRLLRLLASYDIFHEDETRMFSLTPLALPLVADHPASLKAWLTNHDGDEKRWRAYGHMDYSVQTGASAFNHLFGEGFFDFIAHDTNLAQSFDEGMRNISADEETHIVTSYDFSPHKTIIDVGGGKGGLLIEIIKQHPAIAGTLYDLPHTIPSAQENFAAHNIQAACKAGSFFDAVPCDANVYVLKRILHDWDDEHCITILRNCKKAIQPGAKLLIIEAVVAAGNERDFAKDVDMAMLVLFGGKERSLTEWQTLLQRAGLNLVHVHQTPSMLSILEVTADC